MIAAALVIRPPVFATPSAIASFLRSRFLARARGPPRRLRSPYSSQKQPQTSRSARVRIRFPFHRRCRTTHCHALFGTPTPVHPAPRRPTIDSVRSPLPQRRWIETLARRASKVPPNITAITRGRCLLMAPSYSSLKASMPPTRIVAPATPVSSPMFSSRKSRTQPPSSLERCRGCGQYLEQGRASVMPKEVPPCLRRQQGQKGRPKAAAQ